MTSSYPIALVLGGGNALGSYQAGVYQALHEAGHEPAWIVGTSVGAINGALIAGNPPEQRVARLTEFWQPSVAEDAASWWPSSAEVLRRTGAVMLTLGAGRPGVFGPVGPLDSWWDPDRAAAAPALFDSRPLAATLARLADFDRLNALAPRYTACAVDLDTGEEVLFDTAAGIVTADHVRASAALMPAFPAVEIDGRAFVDGGMSANLPLDPVLASPPSRSTLCIAVDLLPRAERRPRTLGESIGRAQDLMFACQTRRTLERWRVAYALDERLRSTSVTLACLFYSDQEPEVAGKGMDFSPESVGYRWRAGQRDGAALLARLASGEIEVGREGLTITEM